MTGKTAEDFKKAFDPLYEDHIALKVYDGLPVSKGTQTYLFTSAQNATPIVKPFWESLLKCASYYKAHLTVIPYRYKNPTSRWTGSQNNEEHWTKEVVNFLNNNRWKVNENLMVLGDIKIVPTAKDPLQGFETFSGPLSSIIGHPNLAFTPVATPGHQMAKILTTTGSCTQPNYTDSRAGKQGEHQHVTGAIIVEVEGKEFWLRHLDANKKGEFIDLDKLFTPDGVFDAPRPEALVTGDVHVRKIDPIVDKAVFGPKGIVERYKPKRVFVHDLFDGLTVNRYDGPFQRLAQMKEGADNVEEEVRECANYLIDRTPDDCEMVVVDSNHHDFLMSWVEEKEWHEVGLNGGFHLDTAKYLWDAVHTKQNVPQIPSPFKYWLEKFTAGSKKNIKCLAEDESYSVDDIENGMHGHRGTDGARGSLKNLVKIGVKFTIGHVHSPGIRWGGYAVGLMGLLKQGYNKGPSSWLQTMCLQHGGPCAGKRQLVTIIRGRHRR